jgi:hypothetical protein
MDRGPFLIDEAPMGSTPERCSVLPGEGTRNSVSATDGYRVLLTRARKGMIVFIPRGDPIGEDETRPQSMYDDIANYLISGGARAWP